MRNKPEYTVTIPASLDISKNAEFEISASASGLAAGTQVRVEAFGGEDFVLTHEKYESITLGYSLKKADGTPVSAGSAVLTAGNTAPGEEVSCVLTAEPEEPEYAGRYSDTLIFDIMPTDAQ